MKGMNIMKIVTAIDSFKGSMTSIEAGRAATEGILRVFPNAEIEVRPLADGGEGTAETLTEGMNGSITETEVIGPLGDKVRARYGIIRDTQTAIIEMSAAAGITLIPRAKLNPLKTTTYGVGEMIRDAVSKGCREFIVGIGGSATNDGGTGMLSALGFEMLDGNGNPIPLGAEGLKVLEKIKDDNVIPELSKCSFYVACDVTNPLCGDNGCSAVYGPQKGADEQMIHDMDMWLRGFAQLTKKIYPKADMNYPGTGAAGGMGFAFKSFLNGQLQPGIDLILERTKLEKYIKDADMVITGEGRLDFQTSMGKAPVGAARLAKKYGKRVIAFSGCATRDAGECNKWGIDAFFPILRDICSLEEAMDKENAKRNMADTAEQVFRLIAEYGI